MAVPQGGRLSGISTHILDIALGRPAVAVEVFLDRKAGDSWQRLGSQQTDKDGRASELLPANVPLTPGEHRIRFETEPYHRAQGVIGLYPFIEITFLVREGDTHLHIPLLLTANGYTTYRGT
jgi:5-hydroxyisourate hydrolase